MTFDWNVGDDDHNRTAKKRNRNDRKTNTTSNHNNSTFDDFDKISTPPYGELKRRKKPTRYGRQRTSIGSTTHSHSHGNTIHDRDSNNYVHPNKSLFQQRSGNRRKEATRIVPGTSLNITKVNNKSSKTISLDRYFSSSYQDHLDDAIDQQRNQQRHHTYNEASTTSVRRRNNNQHHDSECLTERKSPSQRRGRRLDQHSKSVLEQAAEPFEEEDKFRLPRFDDKSKTNNHEVIDVESDGDGNNNDIDAKSCNKYRKSSPISSSSPSSSSQSSQRSQSKHSTMTSLVASNVDQECNIENIQVIDLDEDKKEENKCDSAFSDEIQSDQVKKSPKKDRNKRMFGNDNDSDDDGYSMDSVDNKLDNLLEKINGERCSPSTAGGAISKSKIHQQSLDTNATTHTLLTQMESTPSKSPPQSSSMSPLSKAGNMLKAVTNLGRQKLVNSFKKHNNGKKDSSRCTNKNVDPAFSSPLPTRKMTRSQSAQKKKKENQTIELLDDSSNSDDSEFEDVQVDDDEVSISLP